MSLNTFVAALLGFGLFIGAIALSTDNYIVFVSLAAMILVLGGTLASTFISYEFQYVLDGLRGILRAFKIDRRGRSTIDDDGVGAHASNDVGRNRVEQSIETHSPRFVDLNSDLE